MTFLKMASRMGLPSEASSKLTYVEPTFSRETAPTATQPNRQAHKECFDEDGAKLSASDIELANEMFSIVASDSKILDRHKKSQISSFYSNRSVFVTGGSGFVGKCVLEKLLRSCPDIDNIYILMRPKRDLDIAHRVEALVGSDLFARLRNSPEGKRQLNKVKPIRGDITRPHLGLSDEDIELLSSNVSVVIHSAAAVRFVEPLKAAIDNNVMSVSNLIDLASRLCKLEVLVHISTAYSNCDRKQVDEIFYAPPIDPDRLIETSKWMDPETFENIAPVLFGKRPNSYTYTKAVAEALLLERSKKLLPNIPIALVRPSIVGGTWRQPIRGWVDNYNGPSGVVLAMTSGALQAMLACPSYCADIVPVDVVANLVICAAWDAHQKKHARASSGGAGERAPEDATTALEADNKCISIYNCVSGPLNPISWHEFREGIAKVAPEFPCNNTIREPKMLLMSNGFAYKIYDFFYHTAFSNCVDFFLKLTGSKVRLVRLNNRLRKMVSTLKPFTTNQWEFKCSNVCSLFDGLSPIDQEIFNFDIRQLAWEDYLRRYYVGSKLFVLKDKPHKIAQARRQMNRMRTRSNLIMSTLLVLIYYIFFSGNSLERQTFDSAQNLIENMIG